MQTTTQQQTQKIDTTGIKLKETISFQDAVRLINQMRDNGESALQASVEVMKEFNVAKKLRTGNFASAETLASSHSWHTTRRRRKAADRQRRYKESKKTQPEPITAKTVTATAPANPHQAFHRSIMGILDLPLSDKAKIAAIKAII